MLKQGDRVEVLEAQVMGPSIWRKGTIVSFTKGGKPRVAPDRSKYILTVLKPRYVRHPKPECSCNSHDCHVCRYGSDAR